MTTMFNPLEAATLRQSVIREIDAALGRLPLAQRAIVLEDVILREQSRTDAPTVAVPTPEAASPSPFVAPTRVGAPDAEESHKERLLRILRENPRMPIERLTIAVYGDKLENHRNSVRSMLSAAKNDGFVVNIEKGVWEVAPSSRIAK